MRILVTGASGFAGSSLIPKLLEEGHELRALARDPSRVDHALEAAGNELELLGARGQDFEVCKGDTLSGEGLPRALRGVRVAYYLIHSMESVSDALSSSAAVKPPSVFTARERLSAQNFAQAAHRAGVERIVYLGGLVPAEGSPSPHLQSREEVERILLDAVPGSVALRSSIVIGARSRSFRLMVRLVERLPILALPAWRKHRTQPIDGRDMTELLLASATADGLSGRSLDIAGPDVITYEEMLTGIAEIMLVGRPTLKLKATLTPIAARLAALLAAEDHALILPLMEGLEYDLLPAGEDAAQLLGVELHSFEAAVECALREWEQVEPLPAR